MAGAAIPAPQVPPLSEIQKNDWNRFIDFVDKEGYKGNPVLDDRNKQLGEYLMQKFRALNPKVSITYSDVPRVQSEIQQYRSHLIDQYKKGLIQPDSEIKNPDVEIMPNTSPVDGWLGSKTSSYKFPTATATTVSGQKQDFGTNVAAYDKARGLDKSK